MRIFHTLVALALLGPISLFAQKSPKESAKVWIGAHAQILANSDWSFRISSTQPGESDPYYTWYHNQAGLSTPVQSPNVIVQVVPNRTYSIWVGCAAWRYADVQFNVPAGYTLFMGRVGFPHTPRTTFRTDDYNGSYGTFWMDFELRPNEGAALLPAGYAAPPQLGDVIWSINTGRTAEGSPSGTIQWRSSSIVQDLLNSTALVYADPVVSDVLVARNSDDGSLKYVGTQEAQFYVRRRGANAGYVIEVYQPWVSFDTTNAEWTFSSQPYIEYDVHNPDATWNNRVQITRTQRDAQTTVENWTLSYTPSTNTTTIARSNNLQTLQVASTPTTGGRTEVVTVSDGSGNIASEVKKFYTSYVWGEELTKEIANPNAINGAALTTTYTYYTDGWASSGNVTKLKSVTRPDGSWEKYEYYEDFARWGQLARVYRPWKDGEDGALTVDQATTSNCQVTTYDYVGERDVFKELPASVQTNIVGTTAGLTTIASTLSTNHAYYTWPIQDAPMRTDVVKNYTGPGAYLVTTKTVFHNTAPLEYNGRIYSQINPDGTKVSASYVKGSLYDYTRLSNAWSATEFRPASNGPSWCDTTLYGTQNQTAGAVLYTSDGMTGGQAVDPIWLTPYKSIRKQLVRNSAGNPLASLTFVFNGSGFDLVGWESYSYSSDGLLLGSVDSHGTRYGASYIAGHCNYETKADGTQTQYFFDDLLRVTKSEFKGVSASGSYPAQDMVSTYYSYDGAGRVVGTQITAGTVTQTTSQSFNRAGQLTSSTDALGLTTTYSYSNGGRTVTTTLPGSVTRVENRYLDGQTKSVTGSAVIPTYSHHDLSSAGGESGYLVTVVYSAQDNGPRWSKVVTDWLGRKVHEDKPAYNGGTFTKTYVYNSAGQLAKVTEPGVAPTLYQYNGLGEVEYSGLDINRNDVLDLGGVDRVTQVETKYVSQGAAYWSQTLTYSYGQNNSSASILAGETLTKLVPYDYNSGDYDGGVALSEVDSYDIFRNLTVKKVRSDRANRLVTETTIVPDSTSNVIAITRNGLLQSSQSAQGLVTTYQYDSMRRPTATVDPRIGASTQGYYDGAQATGVRHQLAWTRDPAGNTTSYNYEQTTGRLAVQVNAFGKAVHYAYDALGRAVQTWGEATYPVEYEFNSYGEQVKMRTFRDTTANFAGGSWPYGSYPSPADKGDFTTWNYEAATGLLLSKTDAQNRSVTYTYNGRGQLATRVWARNVTTTYGYDSNTAEQTSITYSDGTPNITYTYDRRGLMASVTDGLGGTRTFDHCDCGKVTAEYLPAFYSNKEIHWFLDTTTVGAKGRTTALYFGSAGNGTNEYGVSFGYDAYGRVNYVGGVTYTYTPNSNLIATAVDDGGNFVQYRTYEPNRNLLASIQTKFGAATRASFGYVSDALGRRTSLTQSGDIFASYSGGGLSTTWGYNDRSEVTSSQTNYLNTSTAVLGRNFGYAYDPIGNRVTSSRDGASSTYTSNSLNQYTQRTDPGQVVASGLAPASGNVTVNSQAATRQGEYFHKSYAVSNGSAAVWSVLNITSDLGGSFSRTAFTPQTPESYTYDNDGNITGDGRWTYQWDAENRLIAMETQASAYSIGTPRQRLEFKYDYLGRRVQKRVLNYSAPGWSLASERRYLYDGWNVVAEYDTTSGASLVAHHVWGIDLSGNLQDAGGVGSLVRSYNYEFGPGIVLEPAYDGNGNVYAMIDRSTGAVRAAYEYSPYGETLRSSGDLADRNLFRFSTKYTDNETQFLYYGFRYYSPFLGRFFGRDPIGEEGGLHLYGFVGNDAVNRVDIKGQFQACYYTYDDAGRNDHGCYEDPSLTEDTEFYSASGGLDFESDASRGMSGFMGSIYDRQPVLDRSNPGNRYDVSIGAGGYTPNLGSSSNTGQPPKGNVQITIYSIDDTTGALTPVQSEGPVFDPNNGMPKVFYPGSSGGSTPAVNTSSPVTVVPPRNTTKPPVPDKWDQKQCAELSKQISAKQESFNYDANLLRETLQMQQEANWTLYWVDRAKDTAFALAGNQFTKGIAAARGAIFAPSVSSATRGMVGAGLVNVYSSPLGKALSFASGPLIDKGVNGIASFFGKHAVTAGTNAVRSEIQNTVDSIESRSQRESAELASMRNTFKDKCQ